MGTYIVQIEDSGDDDVLALVNAVERWLPEWRPIVGKIECDIDVEDVMELVKRWEKDRGLNGD